jgi:Family of unknown function (DUF5677)
MAGRPRGKREPDGVLKGHYKHGRVYRPELLAYGETRTNDWFSDDLPDLLWPLVLVGLQGRHGSAAMSQLQQRVIAKVEAGELARVDVDLDGRLTSLEACTPTGRAALFSLLDDQELRFNLVPPELVGVLRMYADLPGAWLLVEPWADLDGIPDFEAATAIFTDAVVGVLEDRHLNALTKAAPFGWSLLAGEMRFVDQLGDVLINYPMDMEKRSQADAFILTSFLSLKTMRSDELPESATASLEWAQSFWAQNWQLFPCLIPDPDGDVAPDETARPSTSAGHAPGGDPDSDPTDPILRVVTAALGAIDDSYDKFLGTALDHDRYLDLHNPARHEVLCGLVARLYRCVIAILRAPHLWTGEHASATQRIISETNIVMEWLIANGDPAFARYQDYGRGRRKLMSRHTQALVERLGDNAPDVLKDMSSRRDELAGGSMQEEFQEVSVDSTFAEISLRRMAEEVDALDEYRYIIQPTSGVLHGEWWALEEYSMQRCFQILHGGHWIPVDTPEGHPHPEFSRLMVARFNELVTLAVKGLENDSPSP